MKDLPVSSVSDASGRAAIRKYGLVIASACLGASSLAAAPAFASDTTMQLINIMYANGSISQAQYDRLKAAAGDDNSQMSLPGAAQGGQRASNLRSSNQELESEAQNNHESNEAFRKDMNDRLAAMDWVSKIKLKGDIRLRYEYNDNNTRENDAGNSVDRHRGRVRYRLGIITQPMDELEVGAGVASGSNDPRSTNQTFGDDFSSKPIQLDYAYAQYKFNDYFQAVGGKFKFDDYLWAPTDLIWDGDVNPEGTSGHFEVDPADGSTFVNGGVWVLNEFSSNASDPYLYYAQVGQNFESGNLFGAVAGTYYGYQNTAQPDTFNPDYAAGTNTTSQFSVVDVNAQVGSKFNSGKASLIGEYVRNIHSGVSGDQGFAVGAKAGVDKWSFKYLYGDLDRNAVPDVFPDLDRMGGATDMKGHEVAGSYALTDVVELGLDYYNTERKSVNENEQLVQADVSVKF